MLGVYVHSTALPSLLLAVLARPTHQHHGIADAGTQLHLLLHTRLLMLQRGVPTPLSKGNARLHPHFVKQPSLQQRSPTVGLLATSPGEAVQWGDSPSW